MQLTSIAQLTLIGLSAIGVYNFVATAQDSEVRRVCTPLCAMQPNYAARNRLAPDFELTSLSGKKVRLSDYRGKIVILNFWTKTCKPCLEEMPSLATLGKALQRHPEIALVTITTDDTAQEARDTLAAVLGSEPPFEVLVDPEASVVTGRYGTKLFPETWFIDAQGVVRARFDGAREWGRELTIDLAKSFKGPLDCSIDFAKGEPTGTHAALCGEVGAG